MTPTDLDAAATLRAADARGMLDDVHALPDQIDDAWARARAVELPDAYRTGAIKHVVGLGTGGGSRFVLGLARALVAEELPLDFLLRQGYELPTAVGPESLVFALSHSGNTLETVATTEAAVRRRARLVAVSAGGRLLALARERGLPVFDIPDRRIMPRAAVGHLLAPVLCTLTALGLVGDKTAQIASLVGFLRYVRDRYLPERPAAENPAKALAAHCLAGVPVVFSSSLTEVAADRLTRQLAENGKVWAAAETLPAAHHDKIVGLLGGHPAVPFAVVFLRSAWETAEVERRFDGTRRLLLERGLVETVHEVRPDAGDPWEELLHHVMIADFASCYAALARGIDPTAVAAIDDLKRLMGQGG